MTQTLQRLLPAPIYRYRYQIACGIIFLVAVFLRFYKLTTVPYGIHLDEAGMGYDAWCLANYGVTRDLVRYPVYLANYGGGQSALYAYLAALCIKLFGFSLFALRLPGALFSLVAVAFGALVIREGLGRRAALVGAAVLTIAPYYIMQGRFGLDCNLLLGMSALSVWLMLMAVKHQKLWWFALCGLSFGFTLYTYVLSYIIVPAFLGLMLCYLLWIKKVKFSQVLVLGGCVFLLAWPLLLFVYINMNTMAPIETPLFTIPLLPWYRGGELQLYNIGYNVRNILNCALFRDNIPYNTLNGFYTFHLVSIPFILAGMGNCAATLWRSVKSRTWSVTAVVSLFFAAFLCMGLLIDTPNANKLNAMYFPLGYMLVAGLGLVWRKLKQSRVFAGVLVGLYTVSFLAFFGYYYFVYPVAQYPLSMFYPSVSPALDVLAEMDTEGRDIYFSFEGSHIYYVMESELSPYEANIPQNGTLQLGGHLHFYPPEDGAGFDAHSIYVVWETDSDLMQALEEAGFEKQSAGAYYVYAQSGAPV